MMTATADQNQRLIMLVLPFFFVGFVFRFPAGLIMYWITTNIWTIGQQQFLRRVIGSKRRSRRRCRTLGQRRRRAAKAERRRARGGSGGGGFLARLSQRRAGRRRQGNGAAAEVGGERGAGDEGAAAAAALAQEEAFGTETIRRWPLRSARRRRSCRTCWSTSSTASAWRRRSRSTSNERGR